VDESRYLRDVVCYTGRTRTDYPMAVRRPSGRQPSELARSAGAAGGLRQRVAAAAAAAAAAEKSMLYSVNTTISSLTATRRAHAHGD